MCNAVSSIVFAARSTFWPLTSFQVAISRIKRSLSLAGSAERGLQATEPIKVGEELVRVPRQLTVVVADSDKCKYPEIIDPDFFKTCSRTEKLALVLLCEKSLGAGSSVR